MIKPTLEEARTLSLGSTLVPLAMEMFADLKTPVELFRTLAASGREAYILESAASGESWGRYSFLGSDPLMEISGGGGRVTIRRGGTAEIREGNPHSILKELVSSYKSPNMENMPPFTGGFVGYFAYEYIRHIEPTLSLTEDDDIGFDDFRLMLFDRVIAFDHFRQRIFLIVNVSADDIERSYIAGVEALKDMERVVLSTPPGQPAADRAAAPDFEPSFTREAFCEAVKKAKHHILEGDIFQCVPSIRFRSAYRGSLLQPYRVLRTTNPSAYMFLIRFNDLEIAGASPETLVSLKDGVVSTYPLAGTCRRTEDDAETNALIENLLRDEKELAEHDMLVDLGRNDLGRICRFGSVRVDEYRSIKKLSRVCHIASRVTGELALHFSALDVMASVLPAGTLSGAPKKRACEIIDDIEGSKRGVYGGAVGYVDFAGNMDLCIGIRMAVLKDNLVYVQAGAGIVADSVPEREYEECLRKADAMIDAIRAS
ncbi:MAG: anthranilate synthase component I family protein [Synergistaceae bacterium]|nr:anthranilate synthase component I family protein [Synergistaceae bacterium]